jgi:hypothetical protein
VADQRHLRGAGTLAQVGNGFVDLRQIVLER